MKAALVILGIVAAIAAYVWVGGVVEERAELRDQVAVLVPEADRAASRVAQLEERLVTVRAAVPEAREQGYRRGRRDAVRDTCDAIYGSGPTLEGVVLRDGSVGDTWSRSYGEFAIIRAIVVVVSLEDGSSYRITREQCRRSA